MAILQPFLAILHQLHKYILQNWGSDGHFEVLNKSKSSLVQKLGLKLFFQTLHLPKITGMTLLKNLAYSCEKSTNLSKFFGQT